MAAYGPTKLGFATAVGWGFGAEITPLALAHQVGSSVGYEIVRESRDSAAVSRRELMLPGGTRQVFG